MTPPELAAIRARDAALETPLLYQSERDIRALLAMLDAVTRERDAARKALEFYANHDAHRVIVHAGVPCSPMLYDKGQRAREALEVK